MFICLTKTTVLLEKQQFLFVIIIEVGWNEFWILYDIATPNSMRYLCNNRSLCRSEYETLGTPIKSALVYMITALIKLICLATFLEVSESDSFDPYQIDLYDIVFSDHSRITFSSGCRSVYNDQHIQEGKYRTPMVGQLFVYFEEPVLLVQGRS
ncbi:hypothetical protein POM88_052956 [Heracleum sosnowskyi]|uniref:BOS complex subunit TMEM147 n=1 Tax=Heracleum sosnowskyi TaxID=360622 RepID=A0AAD8LYH7_9APIA|nr:hypothetical protein POM88_052956 [Heracleum sosnowskyi]